MTLISHSWIKTSTGRRFDPFSIDPDQIILEDIAQALSNICRFTGHCREFYCPTEDQRILTADLRWVAAGDLQQNDLLLGCDEQPVKANTGRQYRPSRVTTRLPIKRHVWRLELSDGSCVKSSDEHPWLASGKISNPHKWFTTEALARDVRHGRTRWLHRFFDIWETGWLSQRLLDTFVQALLENAFRKELRSVEKVRIQRAYDEGEQWVIGLETSAHTYFSEGFCAHNSVAEHAYTVSLYCDPADALAGLLHDASEAYLADVARPIKHHADMAAYRAIEASVEAAINRKFGLRYPKPASVEEADSRLCITEARQLLPDVDEWNWPHPPYEGLTIACHRPRIAKRMFLDRYAELT